MAESVDDFLDCLRTMTSTTETVNQLLGANPEICSSLLSTSAQP